MKFFDKYFSWRHVREINDIQQKGITLNYFNSRKNRNSLHFKAKNGVFSVDFVVFLTRDDRNKYFEILDRAICMRELQIIKNGLFSILKPFQLLME